MTKLLNNFYVKTTSPFGKQLCHYYVVPIAFKLEQFYSFALTTMSNAFCLMGMGLYWYVQIENVFALVQEMISHRRDNYS